jgi:hypothetical protein
MYNIAEAYNGNYYSARDNIHTILTKSQIFIIDVLHYWSKNWIQTLVFSTTGTSIPGNKSETIPLNNGRSADVSLATFISFMDSNKT